MSKKSQIKWFQKRSCVLKEPHNSLISALETLLKQRQRGYDIDGIYQCMFCNKYHLGHYNVQKRQNLNKLLKIKEEIYGH